jgi:hypothetical protein
MGKQPPKLTTRKEKKQRFAVTKKLFLYSGIFILLSSVLYMTANLERADFIVVLWTPFILVGVLLVVVSVLIKQ